LKEKVVKNITWLFFDKLIRLGTGLIISLLVARHLGPKQFGLFSFSMAFISIFSSFASLGLSNIVVRDLVLEPQLASETLGTAGIMQLFGGLISYILCIIIVTYIRPNDSLVFMIVAILGSILLLKGGDFVKFWFESKIESKYTIRVETTVFFFFAIFKFVLIRYNATLLAFVWTTLAEAILVTLILLITMERIGLTLANLKFSLIRAKFFLKESWLLILTSIATVLNMKIDQVMLGQMNGDQSVGIYSAAVRISEIWFFSIGIILSTIFPILTKMHSNNESKIHRQWVILLRYLVLFSIVVIFFIVIFANNIIGVLFGQAYSESALILKIHAWSGINVAIGTVWSYWILLEGKMKIGLFAQIIAVSLNIILNLILIPYYGTSGAAYATLFSYSASALVSYTLYKPKIFFSYIIVALLPNFIIKFVKK
jgi:O-antigen/teichoic acid export membrane protein